MHRALMASEKIKVIGFDGWTKGVHHYERLVKAFTNRGIELTVN